MIFDFEAMDSTGQEINDVIEASNEAEAQAKVRQLGYFITKISRSKVFDSPSMDRDVYSGNCEFIPMEIEVPQEYVTMTQFNRFRNFVLAVIVVLFIWSLATTALGQEPTLTSGGNGLFQEIAVTYRGQDYCFHRSSSDWRHKPLHWGAWEQWPMNRKDQKSRSFPTGGLNPNLDQRKVSAMLGPLMLAYLDKQQTVSSYYNFTTNPLYDWQNFGGTTYGTFSKTKINFHDTKAKPTPAGRKVEGMDFRFPTRKVESKYVKK